MSYSCISNFGTNDTGMSNPLSVCAVSDLDAGFNNKLGGGILRPENQQCQAFMGMYCANKWDGICEYMSHDGSRALPNSQQSCSAPSGAFYSSGTNSGITRGQILIRNAAAEKYLHSMSSNCVQQFEPFDPTTAGSPLISKWVSQGSCGSGNCNGQGACIPVYKVDPATIDSDPIMNKILLQPWIAPDILVNIYNNAVKSGEIAALKGTKLYSMFSSPYFQEIIKSKKYLI